MKGGDLDNPSSVSEIIPAHHSLLDPSQKQQRRLQRTKKNAISARNRLFSISFDAQTIQDLVHRYNQSNPHCYQGGIPLAAAETTTATTEFLATAFENWKIVTNEV